MNKNLNNWVTDRCPWQLIWGEGWGPGPWGTRRCWSGCRAVTNRKHYIYKHDMAIHSVCILCCCFYLYKHVFSLFLSIPLTVSLSLSLCYLYVHNFSTRTLKTWVIFRALDSRFESFIYTSAI